MIEVRRPILLLVGGPGGAGKTTLARSLGDRLGFVHLSRDAVKSAIAVTDAEVSSGGAMLFDEAKAGMGGEYGQRAFVVAYAAARVLLEGGASVIVDQAWRSGRSETELEPLLELSRPMLLIAKADSAVEQERARRRGHRAGLAPLEEVIVSVDAERDAFLTFDLGVPRLLVDTSEGYDPQLPDIERWITANA